MSTRAVVKLGVTDGYLLIPEGDISVEDFLTVMVAEAQHNKKQKRYRDDYTFFDVLKQLFIENCEIHVIREIPKVFGTGSGCPCYVIHKDGEVIKR